MHVGDVFEDAERDAEDLEAGGSSSNSSEAKKGRKRRAKHWRYCRSSLQSVAPTLSSPMFFLGLCPVEIRAYR